MAYMMANGFKSANGRIIQLSSDSKEAVQLILDEADDFVRKQLAVEKDQVETHRRLDEKDKIDREQSKRLDSLQKLLIEKDQIDEKQEKEILLLVEHTKQKDVLDKEQSENIQKTVFVLSIVALTISVGTLIFSILHLYLQ
jgi:hypothetical protein